jgi:ABC-type dipeptide/oligopeptide/nickel transport system permease component
VIRRSLQFILAAAAVFIVSRVLIRTLPGDPLDSLLAETALTIPRDKIAEDLGLNLSLIEQLRRDFNGLLHGDLGYSLITREPVLEMLLPRLVRTMALAFGALTVALSIGVPAGLLCAANHGSSLRTLLARVVRATMTFLVSIPLAWIGPALLYVFTILLPLAEFRGSWVLACAVLALPLAGNWARIVELRTREEMNQPFFQAALARGLPEWKAILKNGLAPSAGALLATLGSQAGALLAGSFIAEWIFDWPGMGIAWVQATLQRDYPVMEASTFLGALTCLAGVFIGDLLQQLWDPRQREERST